jgi:hypothetical protein
LRAGGILLGVALIALTVSNAMLLWPRMHEAVVLINQTPARVSPVPMGDTAFVLREAETVTMTAQHEDFILVRTRGGLSGWVARANLGTVVPQVSIYPLQSTRIPAEVSPPTLITTTERAEDRSAARSGSTKCHKFSAN